jgi:ribosome-associated protein
MRKRRRGVDDSPWPETPPEPHAGEDEGEAGQARKSKSQRKREHLALEPLARDLMALSERRLKELDLDEALLDALRVARTLERGALQRQLRYLRGLLAEIDTDTLRATIASWKQPQAEDVRAMHEVEAWRDALIEGDDALVETLCARFATLDRAAFETLVAEARAERAQGRPPRASRQLFRLLRGAHGT